MFTTTLAPLPSDPRIIGAYVVGGVTHYTYADSGPLAQLPSLETARPASEAKPACVPFCRPRVIAPPYYLRAYYLRAYAADAREWRVPVSFASASAWATPLPWRNIAMRSAHVHQVMSRLSVA